MVARITRRSALAAAAGAALFSSARTTKAQVQAGSSVGADGKGTRIVLLGTMGGPVFGQSRRMTSVVLVNGGDSYVLDCGYGCADQLARAGIPLRSIRDIFITHHHPDHVIDYGSLLLASWLDGRRESVATYGPAPLARMTAQYLEMMQSTIDDWRSSQEGPPMFEVRTHDLSTSGEALRDERVTVRYVQVDHPPLHALGFRFDFGDRSVVFSGDTVRTDAIVELARGADTLVHEAMYMPAVSRMVDGAVRRRSPEAAATAPGLGQQPDPESPYGRMYERTMKHMLRSHASAEDAGMIATRAGVRKLVLYHLVPGQPFVSEDQWRDAAAKTFSGEIVVGRDLMEI
jgi:ribonuclease BN (tRNA processing enzyme)